MGREPFDSGERAITGKERGEIPGAKSAKQGGERGLREREQG